MPRSIRSLLPLLPFACLALLVGLTGCGERAARLDQCSTAPLPLQNARAHTLGETFYLPSVAQNPGCPSDLSWEIESAPTGSRNRVYMEGAPQPRFTPDMAGDYRFRLRGLEGSIALRVVARTPQERFRNHHLTPLYGAARVEGEVWTANGASYTVSRVGRDTSSGTFRKLGDITVGSWPAALAWTQGLSYVVVAHRGSDTIGFIDRARGVLEDALWVGDEPTGLVIAPGGQRLYVSLPTMRQVAVVDLTTRQVASRIDLGFDPRALALSPDGRYLHVASYRSGNRVRDEFGTYGPNDDQDVWIVDTQTGSVIERVTGVADTLRALALSPDGRTLYVAGTDGNPLPSQADASANPPPFEHLVTAIAVDPGASNYGEVQRRADLLRQAGSGGAVVNPSGLLVTEDTVWVSSQASSLVVALDRATLAERTRVPVGLGARQILQLDGGLIAVHCFLARELWILDASGAVVAQVALADEARPADVVLGEQVFYRPGGGFATNHACESCHVETQNGGMIWRFGPSIWHNVRPLQLLAATRPLEWGAYVSSAENFGYQGPSSIVARPATPAEASGLTAFLSSLLGAPRATGWTRPDGSYTEQALRGKALFEGKATCSTCHAPPLYTSREYIPLGKSGEPADVPTIFGVYRHGVYLVGGGARSLEQLADVALNYVNVQLTAGEKADLVEFLRELTPKGGHPLGLWPDKDNAEGVYPDVRPYVEFADPVDDSVPGRTQAQVAADYVVLEDASGQRVAGSVNVTGWRIEFVPAAPLEAGASYRFRVLEGLPFQSGGALWAERATRFTVAQPAAGTLPAGPLQMTVSVPGPNGVADLPFLLVPQAPTPGAQQVVLQPLVFGAQQRQVLWMRIDGDRFLLEPFALPISPTGVADANRVRGTLEVTGGQVTRITGTLRITGPQIDIPGVAFTIGPPAGGP